MKKIILQKWRRRWFQLRQGAMPGQFVLQYYVDQTGKKLKGSIDLDQCEQVILLKARIEVKFWF